MTQPGPNPQTNLIFSIVAPVVALIAVAVIYFTRPTPAALTAPTPVNVAAAKLPANTVVMANALPNAGNGPSGTAGSGAPGGTPGGPPGGIPGGGGPPAGIGRAGGGGKGGAGGLGAN